MIDKKERLKRRQKAGKARAHGTAEKPRLQVFRSSKYIYAQVIDDETGKTLLSESDFGKKDKKNKTESAFLVGEGIAKKAKEKKITKIVFDRSGYLYHGRVKAVAEGARKGGLQF